MILFLTMMILMTFAIWFVQFCALIIHCQFCHGQVYTSMGFKHNRCRWSFFYDNYLAFDAECAKHWKKKILLHFLSFKYLFPSISLFSSISWSTYACGHMTIMNCKRKSTWKGPRNFFYEKIHEKATWFASLFLNYPIYPNGSITLCQIQEGSN